jgi:type IV pilus assembly protein PilC
LPITPKRAFSVSDIFIKLNSVSLTAKKISARELAVFCRKTAFLLDAGLPIKDAMPVLVQQTSGRKNLGAVSDLHRMVMQGESFSYALKETGVFPTFMCGYIAIGENTARLPEICTRLADYYDAKAQTEAELATAMMYPFAVAVMMFGVIVAAVTFVLPSYSRIFDASGVALPRFTAALLAASGFLANNTFAVFGGFFIFLFALSFFLQSKNGKIFSAHIYLKIPILRQNINRNLTNAFSLLLSSGLSISEAIPLCIDVLENSVVKSDLKTLSARVNSGAAFWSALGEISYVNPLLVELARIGEESGNLSAAMEKCNTYFEEAYKSAVRRLNKLIEPVVTLVLGIILAAIMLAIILPTFELATVF